MKFHEYITQRRAFGRTPWLRAILIWGLSGALIVYGVWLLVERDWWGLAPLLIGIAVRCILGFGTKANWETDKAREENGSSNKHRDDVCETCDPVCWKKDGAPLQWLYEWYAATRDVSWSDAIEYLRRCPEWQREELVKHHAKYLDHPKFRKFKTK